MSISLALPKYFPELHGLNQLFDAGCAGFDLGTTVLISGRPGHGRTIMALAMCRELLRSFPHAELFYITTEMSAERLRRRFAVFGWFANSAQGRDKLFERAHIIYADEIELPQPTRGASTLISKVLSEVRGHRGRRGEGPAAFVVVDSVTALLKDSKDDGDRRRNVVELVSGLEEAIGKEHLCLTFMTAEHDASEVPIETHLADVVFQIGLQDTGAGRRLRTLEVTKCHGNYMAMGLHTWAIVTEANCEGVIAQQSLVKTIREKGAGSGTQITAGLAPLDLWSTVAIFPRPRFPKVGSLQSWRVTTQGVTDIRESMGTPGLDEMLSGDSEYWLQTMQQALDHPYTEGLIPGSTTVFIGRSGTGKTLALLQFLLANSDIDKSLYINFENPPSRVLASFPGSKDDKLRLEKCQTLYRRRLNLDFNALLAEVNCVLETCNVTRVAIDGLSDLAAFTDPQTYARMTEEFLITLRDAERSLSLPPVSVCISLKTDRNSTVPPMLDAFSFATDNIFVLQSVFVDDEQRKTIHVIQARGQAPDAQVRELVVSEGKSPALRVVPGLENYAGLHTNDPKPVLVALQFLAENSAEDECNRRIVRRLRKQYGYPVRQYAFSRADIRETLGDIAAGLARIPFADVKLLSIDEWWIRELRVAATQSSGKSYAETPPPLLRLDTCMPAIYEEFPAGARTHSTEFWAFELEKASALVLSQREVDREKSLHVDWHAESQLVASPNYADYGLFCLNLSVAKSLGYTTILDATWTARLTAIPRQWATYQDGWFCDPLLGGPSIVKLAAELLRKDSKHCAFAFDMETPATAVCTFLEFCWAFGATEDFLIRDVELTANELSEHPATLALRFLQYLVLHNLMPSRTTLRDTKRSLFSRHWYSSLCDVQKDMADVNGGLSADTGFWTLPFFPVGALPLATTRDNDGAQYCPSAIWHAVLDLIERLRRLINRVGACLKFRRCVDIPNADSQTAKWLKQLGEHADAARTEMSRSTNGPGHCTLKELCDKLEPGLTLFRTVGASIRTWALISDCFQSNKGYYWPKGIPVDNSGGGPQPSWLYMTAARWMDARDVIELCAWNEFRIAIVEAELQRRPLSSVYAATSLDCEGPITALTGYACAGSWMAGVDRRTHSPNLAAKFIAELTSSSSALDRAELGAGIPSRKDFFDHHGNEPVTHLHRPELSWRRLLRDAGSRARRRDRLVCSRVHMSHLIDMTHRLLHHALLMAGEMRSDYEANPKRRPEIVVELKQQSQSTIEALLQSARKEMQAANSNVESGTCLMCPAPEVCARAIQK